MIRLLACCLAAAGCLALAPPAAADTTCRRVDPTSATDDVVTVCLVHEVDPAGPYVEVGVTCHVGRFECADLTVPIGDPS